MYQFVMEFHKYFEIRLTCTGKNQVLTYYFDVKECKVCPYKNGCYKDKAKSKTYSITILPERHKEQKDFQGTEYFKERLRQR